MTKAVFTELTSFHKRRYGMDRFNPQGTSSADPARCAKGVRNSGALWGRQDQCTRKRGHGPEQAYCAQHDPERRAAREAARREKEEEDFEAQQAKVNASLARRTMIWLAAPAMKDALQRIRDGVDDPREIAAEALRGLEGGEG